MRPVKRGVYGRKLAIAALLVAFTSAVRADSRRGRPKPRANRQSRASSTTLRVVEDALRLRLNT